MPEKPTLIKTYETICILAFFSIAAGLWFQRPGLFYAALLFLFLVLFIKKAAAWLAWGWLQFSHFIGTVNTKIILTLIFFLILTPIAFLYRLFYGDSLNIRHKTNDSTWHHRDYTYQKSDLDKAW
jgi:Saxitoxin biosynthesis operon protein SxtJ